MPWFCGLPLIGHVAFVLNVVSGAIVAAACAVRPGWVKVALRNMPLPRWRTDCGPAPEPPPLLDPLVDPLVVPPLLLVPLPPLEEAVPPEPLLLVALPDPLAEPLLLEPPSELPPWSPPLDPQRTTNARTTKEPKRRSGCTFMESRPFRRSTSPAPPRCSDRAVRRKKSHHSQPYRKALRPKGKRLPGPGVPRESAHARTASTARDAPRGVRPE
jgi:hypothetical protein